MSTPLVRDLRLVPLAAIVWATALGCVFFPLYSWWLVLAGVACAAMALGLLLRDRARGRAPRGGLLVLLALAAAAAAMTAALAVPQREAAAEWDGQSVEVVGEITSSASTGSDGRIWFDVNTHTVGDAETPNPLAVPMRIGTERIDGLELGAVIRASGQTLVTDPGERAALVLFGDDIEVVTPAEGVFGVAAEMRADFVERAVALPEPGAGLLPGLAVGDTRAVSEELNTAMLLSGLSHLTAVSGPNC